MEDLKNKISEYIKQCGYTWDFAAILKEYKNYSEGIYVSHTAKDVIATFEKELRKVKFEQLETFEAFEKLNKGDFILVEWDRYFIKHNNGAREMMFYKIYEHKKPQQEIICKMPQNHYFNYHCILVEKSSSAKKVYLISNGEDRTSE